MSPPTAMTYFPSPLGNAILRGLTWWFIFHLVEKIYFICIFGVDDISLEFNEFAGLPKTNLTSFVKLRSFRRAPYLTVVSR